MDTESLDIFTHCQASKVLSAANMCYRAQKCVFSHIPPLSSQII